jgi:hypothetical protein
LVEQLRAGDAVRQRVVHLGHARDAAAFEALEDPQLPQRPGAVQRPARDLGDHLADLVEPAGRGHAHAPDVVLEVEVRILDPHRVVQAERCRDELPPERREQVESRTQRLLDSREALIAPGRVRPRVDDRHLDRVLVRGRHELLCVEELRVDR